MRLDHDLDSSFAADEEPRFSDVEDMSATHNSDLDTEVPKDYWFGKKYFECVIAQDLLYCMANSDSVSAMDTQLERKLRDYHCREAWNSLGPRTLDDLGTSSARNDKDYRACFLSLIGRIVRRGSAKEKRSLLATLRKFQNIAPQTSGFQQKTYAQDIPTDARNLMETRSAVSATSRFTGLLKEHGDQIGVTPQYRSQTVSLEPPLFKEILNFQGFTFEGQGRSKKQAKHQASKEACEFLGLQAI